MEGDGLRQPTILVIFGISGDLSRRYLLPALAEIAKEKQLPRDFKVLGVSRRDLDLDEILPEAQKELRPLLEIFQMNLSLEDDYKKLKTKIDEDSKSFGQPPQVIFYLSVPPVAVQQITDHLGSAGLNQNSKLMLEKPFGVDLESARSLTERIAKYFKEEQLYPIDHYLAKEMAQNIVVFWGSNTILRNVWSNEFIDRIDIMAAEKIDIEGRGQFYEATGALRDFAQNHLLQLAALILMEPCSNLFEFEELPQRRLAALQQLNAADPAKALRAQYDGYCEEVKNPGSEIETFVAIELSSKNPRWQGVPIHLVTGKNLNERLSEITVHFKKTEASEANTLKLRIQPNEGIELELWIKKPGYEPNLEEKPLSFDYEKDFARLPNAYEQVLVDAMRGSHSLFASSPEIIESWRVLQPLLDTWSKTSADLRFYKPGSTVAEVIGEEQP